VQISSKNTQTFSRNKIKTPPYAGFLRELLLTVYSGNETINIMFLKELTDQEKMLTSEYLSTQNPNTLSDKNARFNKKIHDFFFRLSSSRIYRFLTYLSLKIFSKLSQMPFITPMLHFVIDTDYLYKKYYWTLPVILIVAYPSCLGLVTLFEESLQLFLFFLLPIIFINIYNIVAIFYYIDERENGKRCAIKDAFLFCLKRFYKIGTIFFFYSSIILELTFFFFLFSMIVSLYFTQQGIDWGTSTIYWTFVVFYGLIILFQILLAQITASQAFYFSMIEKKSFFQSITYSWKLLQINLSKFLYFYIILLFIYIPIISFSTITFFDSGFSISLFLFTISVTVVSYFLRRYLVSKKTIRLQIDKTNLSPFFRIIYILICLLGIPCYVLFSIILSNIQPNMIKIVKEQQANIITSRMFSTYRNTEQGYSINYPRTWSIYKWNDNSITLYNNYIQSEGGGIWVTVTVSSIYQTPFFDLYYKDPGIASYEWQTHNITTKISNISLQGYDGIKYTFAKQGQDFIEYQMHYLFHKQDRAYDVNFTTHSKDVENNNSELFDRMMKSFKILK
jgi:hypothetical protein